MNGFALGAGVLVILAFLAHAIVGGRELALLTPAADQGKARLVWTQTVCGWHWVSFDLLAAGAVLLGLGMTDLFAAESAIFSLLALYFLGVGSVWLVTAAVAGRGVPRRFLALGQWIFCWVVAALTWLAA
ncbi:MAG: hypothetical protein AAF604_06905 [Acidobacteriota bacterium]